MPAAAGSTAMPAVIAAQTSRSSHGSLPGSASQITSTLTRSPERSDRPTPKATR